MPKNAELVTEAYKIAGFSQKNSAKNTQNQGKGSNKFEKNKKYGKMK